jgi:16S rRNA (guanine1516-N2)-methyltransferase
LSERSPVLAWLLESAVSAALISQHQQVREAAARMRVVHGDSCNIQFMHGQGDDLAMGPNASDTARAGHPQVIYLDPMFPEKKSAAAKKDLALLQRLHSDVDDTGEQLLFWALTQPVSRIVIKRPIKAPFLGQHKPSHSIAGKAVRFDVVVR